MPSDIMLDSLCIYRNLLEDPVIGRFQKLVNKTLAAGTAQAVRFIGLYAEFFNSLAAERPDLDFYSYMIEKILFDDNPFTRQAGSADPVPDSMAPAVKSDLRTLQAAALLTSGRIKEYCCNNTEMDAIHKKTVGQLPDWNHFIPSNKTNGSISATTTADVKAALLSADDWSGCYEKLKLFHQKNGCGAFAHYKAFIWQRSQGAGRLVPVKNPDPVRLTDLIDYETERFEVVRNTENFLNGYPANNVLLYGDRGTGKSSTVKAILNEYHDRGLRVIEVPKNLLVDFAEIVSGLGQRNHKFILFVDDLAFEDNEENYTALKAVLEGSLELKPSNVLIYATSNRRHLIKEKFSERAGLQYGDSDDEVRAYDTMQEKLSLSDRFGITVVFSSPDKKRYLHIIDELAARCGIDMDTEELHREAMKWEMWYNGRSPRTAQQFIAWIKGGGI